MFHHVGISWMIEAEDQYNFSMEDNTKNGLKEGHGLMRQCFRVFMEIYLRNYLSQHVNVDLILCVDCRPTANEITSPLAQHLFMAVGLYQNIQLKILLFLFKLILILLNLGLKHWTITLHSFVWHIKIRSKKSLKILHK